MPQMTLDNLHKLISLKTSTIPRNRKESKTDTLRGNNRRCVHRVIMVVMGGGNTVVGGEGGGGGEGRRVCQGGEGVGIARGGGEWETRGRPR